MFSTLKTDAAATITEMRNNANGLLEAVNSGQRIIIQSNNEPQAVLLSYEDYREIVRQLEERERPGRLTAMG